MDFQALRAPPVRSSEAHTRGRNIIELEASGAQTGPLVVAAVGRGQLCMGKTVKATLAPQVRGGATGAAGEHVQWVVEELPGPSYSW